ncbi:hypothetical protein PF005_g18787 [Phytophthora fragariae]|uniref:Uncharacterized protein n=1 Tax=Phytophthora fragariae TaxID=53985 RepID=A0A6A3E634_9STRA|nr:hypothetical protein PF003_g34383 [Phytophthora fragariae]KAE8926390.1 hypothetical protein PF009_g23415 [Phytophthora fragariae]KAE9003518.1 hypothetical protein PF011_g12868 [Phytophthora fragariae]KAE9091455.1 hypothetical protein PF007_g18869 [Phytophthora fragariae]KAE9121622.1 hypothetical protein PF006_g17855 [Phytophthora fragariae]
MRPQPITKSLTSHTTRKAFEWSGNIKTGAVDKLVFNASKAV